MKSGSLNSLVKSKKAKFDKDGVVYILVNLSSVKGYPIILEDILEYSSSVSGTFSYISDRLLGYLPVEHTVEELEALIEETKMRRDTKLGQLL